MEMFYGDETLGALIEHTKFVKNEIENYRSIMDITESYEELRDIPINDDDDREEKEEEN